MFQCSSNDFMANLHVIFIANLSFALPLILLYFDSSSKVFWIFQKGLCVGNAPAAFNSSLGRIQVF